MHRIVTAAGALLSVLLVAAPATAGRTEGEGDAELRRLYEERAALNRRIAEARRDQRMNPERKPVPGVPSLFDELTPHRASRIRALSDERPEWARRALKRMDRMAAEMNRLQHADLEEFERRAELFRLEDEVERAADALREAKDDTGRQRLRQRLGETLAALFDHKLAMQKARITRLERELEDLRGRLNRRTKLRSKIIERRLNELQEGEDLSF